MRSLPRSMVVPGSVLALSLVAVLVATCGSRLPREVTLNRPTGESLPIDLTKVNFTDLATGNQLNAAEYMDSHSLNYMVLTFSSQSCSTCMEKAHYLETNLVGHYAQLGPNSNQFELHGVNTDVASARPQVLQNMKLQNLTHINWADTTGAESMMMTYFQPNGKPYGVPLTVMVDRHSILWTIPSDEHIELPDLLRKIGASMGQGNVEVKPTPTPSKKPPVEISALAEEKPGRLAGLTVNACGASTATTAHEVFAEADLKFLVVDKANCAVGSTCDQDRLAVTDFLSTCQGKTCQLMTLGQTLKNGDAACANGVFAGGEKIFATFKEHFNWHYELEFDPGLHLAPLNGPLVMAFDSEGKLVFSKEGTVTKQDLVARWGADQFTHRAEGPAYKIYTTKGERNFSEWRQQAKYSVVQLWGFGCSGCEEELTTWHMPGHLVDWCASRPDFCQIVSVEDSYPADDMPGSVPNYFNTTFLAAVKAKNPIWKPDLMAMDLTPPQADAGHRWFSGWGWGTFGDDPVFGTSGRAVLYDREGKIVDSWVSKADEHGNPPGTEVFEALKKLSTGTH